jgi:Tol biopolymer transport system component
VFRYVDDNFFSIPPDASPPAVQLTSNIGLSLPDLLDWVLTDEWIVWRGNISNDMRRSRIDGSALSILAHPPISSSAVGPLSLSVSPDGTRVLYLADHEKDNRIELFSVAVEDSSDLVKHSTPLEAYATDVRAVQLSVDGDLAVFEVENEVAETRTLHAAPTDGSTPPVQLLAPFSGPPLFDGSERLSADSNWLVYRDLAGPTLYSVRTDGSGGTHVLSNLFFVYDHEIVDSTTVVFRGSFAGMVDALATVPIDGSSAASLLSTVSMTVHAWAPTSDAHAVFVAEQAGNVFLFRVPNDGSQSAAPMTAALPSTAVPFQMTADASTAVFVADAEVAGRFDLYAVPLDGSLAATRLSALAPDEDVVDFELTADGSRVVYSVALTSVIPGVPTSADLRSVPVDGSSAPIVLGDGTGLPLTVEALTHLELSPDGTLVAFPTSVLDTSVSPAVLVPGEQRIVPVDGGAAAFVVPGSTGQRDGRFSPDGQRYLFTEDGALFSARIGKDQRPVLVSPLAPGESVDPATWAVTSKRVVYTADQGEPGVTRLFAAPIGAQHAGGPLAGASVADGDVLPTVSVTADGSRVVYIVDANHDEVFELYSVALRPEVDSVSPSSGFAHAPSTVVIEGRNFVPGVKVLFGGVPAPNVVFESPTRLRVKPPVGPTPTGTSATVGVVVFDGTAASLDAATYTYLYRHEPGAKTPL